MDDGGGAAAAAPQFVVVGAGGIGGVVGAHFARAGHAVLLVDVSAEHVASIRERGLSVEGLAGFTIRVPAVTPAGLAKALGGAPARTVLLAVKAHHTVEALEPVLPLLDGDGVVVSLQNGLNERDIAERAGARRTIGAFVNFGADYLGPGRVLLASTAELYLGELDGRMTDRLERLGATFREAFLPHTTVTPNIWGYLWGKLGYAAMLFATAATDETMAAAFAKRTYHPLLANLAAEVVRVADAEGVRCEGFSGYDPDVMRFRTPRDWDGIHRVLDRRAEVNGRSLNSHNGIWRDIVVKRRRTEVDSQLGAVVRVAHTRGVPVPLNERVIEVIHELESGRRAMSSGNVDELCRLSDAVYPS